jgi:hypothetical protein
MTATCRGNTATDLRARGLALCKPDPGTKSPTHTAWPTRSKEPKDFAEDDLIGILGGPLSSCNQPGHALVILDLDDLQALEKADDFLPATGMEEGRPGKLRDHRYFLVPVSTIPSWAESTADQAAPAAKKATGHPGPFKKAFTREETKERVIDFHGTGGQCVCPGGPSPRQWEGGEPGEPAIVSFGELWEATCRLALACGCKLPSVNGEAEEQKTWRVPVGGDVIKRCVAYLDTIPGAVAGHNGHDGTYWPARVACWGFDLGEQVGFDVLWKHFNHRCSPAWTEKELRHKCHDADTLPFNKPRGWLLTAEPERTTDRGNGRRLVRLHGRDLRFVHPWGKWLVWDKCRWRPDDTAAIMRRAKAVVVAMFGEAADEVQRIQQELEQQQAEVPDGE